MKRLNVILPILFLSFLVFIILAPKGDAITTEPLTTVDPSATGTQCDRTNGDANCDGVTDIIDYLYYVRHVAGATIFPPEVNLDVNNSGGIDDNDRCVIVRGITGNTDTCNSST